MELTWDERQIDDVFAQQYDFKHITSSPHFAQSNGKAESAVKTCKRLMEKATEDREGPHLALLAWRNTPAEQLGPSPAQLMFGRRTRTHLPMTEKMLASTYDSTAHEALKRAKERQAYYYDVRGETAFQRWRHRPYTVEQETTVGQSGSDQSTSVPIIRATLRGRLRA